MKSSMLVSGGGGGVRSWASGDAGTPSTMPPATAETAPIFTNSRRVTSVDVGIG